MPLLPYASLLIDSPLPVDEAAARLQRATGPRSWLQLGPRRHSFEGRVNGHEVRIHRAIGYASSFLPRIRGRLEPRAEGCRLTGTMSLHPGVAAVVAVVFGAMLIRDLPIALSLLAQGDFRSGWGIPAILIFIWVLCSGAFTIEARIARKRLAGLLDESDNGR